MKVGREIVLAVLHTKPPPSIAAYLLLDDVITPFPSVLRRSGLSHSHKRKLARQVMSEFEVGAKEKPLCVPTTAIY